LRNFGLVGNKLSHSFSKNFFTNKFMTENISAQYNNFELSDINQIRNLFESKIISGLNVTVPYKKTVIKYLDSLDPLSKKISAVNTIYPTYENAKLTHLKGFNTDLYGFKQLVKPYLKSHHERALVLGTGGASAAVAYVLREYNIDVNFISRSPKLDQGNVFSWDTINDYMISNHLLIINTTPLGMFPNNDQLINIPYQAINKNHLVIDLIYNPIKTIFLKNAQKNNAQILNGHQMLIHQAIKAWNIWNSSTIIK
jgi:shikimate dehydrogenase